MNPARERGELLLAPDGWPGLRASALQHAAALEQHATAWQAQQQQLSTQVGILTEQYAHITADYKALAALLKQEKTG